MRLDTVTLLMTLVALTAAQQYYGQGRELGRVNGRLTDRHWAQNNRHQSRDRQDSNSFDGNAQQKAKWSGESAVRDNQRVENEQALKQNAHTTNHRFGKFNTGFADMAKQIRDESAKNQYALNDDAQYKRNNLNSAEGANQAKAKKTAFKKGGDLDSNIRYVFNKKFKKTSSENGGYDEENGRNIKKLNLLDEREKDSKVSRGDSQMYQDQSDQEKAAKHSDWKSSARQNQAQEGKYGAANRREDQAGERSSDRATDSGTKSSRYLEQERGKDEAVRLAKDQAESEAGYTSKNTAAADAYRSVADAKYYGGKQVGASPAAAGKDDYGPDGAAQAAAAVPGTKGRHEGSGGSIKSGFDENAAQQENANELASATAGSRAQALNDYQRNKDTLAHDRVTGVQDRAQGQFKTGLKDANSRGFTGNSAQADKSAAASDTNSAAAQSASSLETKKKNENEALHSRNYFRKIQNDDSENFTRQKQFFHSKKEGGDNDEKLQFARKNQARNYGAADEARLSSDNKAKTLHEDGKVSSKTSHAEDVTDRRKSLHLTHTVKQGAEKKLDNQDSREDTQAASASNGFNKGLEKSTHDDSQSQAFNKRQRQQNQVDSDQRTAEDSRENARNAAANVEYVRPTDGKPLGELTSRDLIDAGLLRGQPGEKAMKEHKLPDVVVDIKPIDPPPKAEQPKRTQPVPALPEVQQVKTYHPVKHTKPEVNYDTGRAAARGSFSQPTFGRLGALSIFQGPRQATFNPDQQSIAKSPVGPQRVQPQKSFSSGFGNGLFGNAGRFSRFVRGTYAR